MEQKLYFQKHAESYIIDPDFDQQENIRLDATNTIHMMEI